MKSCRREAYSLLHGVVLWPVLSIALCWQVEAGADEPKTADELIAKHLDALGGPEKLAAAKTMRITGKSSFGSGAIKNATVFEYKRPQKLRMQMSQNERNIVQAVDGTTGWVTMSSKSKIAPGNLPPDVVEMMRDQADFRGALVDYKDKKYRIELAGKAEANGSKCHKLKVTKPSGVVEHYFLDAKSFLVVQIKGKRKFRSGEKEYTVTLGDYREVDGLMVAHSIKGGLLTGDMTVQKVELNVELPDARFRKP